MLSWPTYTQHKRLCLTVLQVKKTSFSATKMTKYPTGMRPRLPAIHSISYFVEFPLTKFNRGSKPTRAYSELGEMQSEEYVASLSDGSFWGIRFQLTQNNITGKENKRLFAWEYREKKKKKEQNNRKCYCKCNQNQGHLIYSILQPSDVLGKCLAHWNP